MKKTETLNLRISPDFKKRLIHEAAKEKRSVTNYLEVTLANIWNSRDEDDAYDGSRKKGLSKKPKE